MITRRLLALAAGIVCASAVQILDVASARADELGDIAKAGVLKVGIFEDFPPFSSAGPDLKSQGYDIDVIDALAKAMGVNVNWTRSASRCDCRVHHPLTDLGLDRFLADWRNTKQQI